MPNVVAGSRASFTAPMLTDPGEEFIYGINIDWLGKVVEAVIGVGLDVAIKLYNDFERTLYASL